MRPLVAAGVFLLILSGCSSSSSDPDRVEDTAAETVDTEADDVLDTFDAYVAVVAMDPIALLDGVPASCEHLPGDLGVIHTNAEVSLLSPGGSVVSTTLLGPPDVEPTSDYLCAWAAVFESVPSDTSERYVASIGKWRSQSLTESQLASERLVISTSAED